MAPFHSITTPLGSGKITEALDHVGPFIMAGKKCLIAQSSINLIDRSMRQFRERWPDQPLRAIHSETSRNVSREIFEHVAAASSGGQVVFITHAALVQNIDGLRRTDWNVIIDEASTACWIEHIRLSSRHKTLIAAFGTCAYNSRYSTLVAEDVGMLERMAAKQCGNDGSGPLNELAEKVLSPDWTVFVPSEQFERLRSGQSTDDWLSVTALRHQESATHP